MNPLFEKASSYWVRYDRYELKEGQNGITYVTPASDAVPQVYDPLKSPEEMIVAALNVGMLCMGKKSEEVIPGCCDGFCVCIRPSGAHDGIAHHTQLYGLRSSIFSEEQIHSRRIYGCVGLSQYLLSFRQTEGGKTR